MSVFWSLTRQFFRFRDCLRGLARAIRPVSQVNASKTLVVKELVLVGFRALFGVG